MASNSKYEGLHIKPLQLEVHSPYQFSTTVSQYNHLKLSKTRFTESNSQIP